MKDKVRLWFIKRLGDGSAHWDRVERLMTRSEALEQKGVLELNPTIAEVRILPDGTEPA